MTPAKDIQLSKKALRLLRAISKGKYLKWSSVEKTPEYKTLTYYGLVFRSSSCPSGTITEKGMQVLLCHQHAKENRKQEHLHNWCIAIFSAFAGALLSKPLWDGIERLADWISSTP